MPRLTIHTAPPIVLEPPRLITASRAALGAGGESPVVDVELDAGRGELAALLDPPPVRERATLTYDDGTELRGLVQAVRLGANPTITLEA